MKGLLPHQVRIPVKNIHPFYFHCHFLNSLYEAELQWCRGALFSDSLYSDYTGINYFWIGDTINYKTDNPNVELYMDQKDIRWVQRLQNFKKAFQQLCEALKLPNPSRLEKAGIIQIYEFTFELAWKTLKDFLEEKGVTVKYPKDTIKEAFKDNLIEDGDIWMDMLEKRNLMSHTYNETTAEFVYTLIAGNYSRAIEQLFIKLSAEL